MKPIAKNAGGPAAPLIREATLADPARVDVSIVIVTWNSERWIGGCLQSLVPASGSLRCEVLVHDNASSDGSRRIAASHDAVRLLEAEGNLGFAAGINRASAEARGRYLFLLNPDCVVSPCAVAELVDFLDQNPSIAAAAPLLLDDTGKPQREFQLRRLPTFRSLAAEILLVDKLFPENRQIARYRYRDLDITRPQLVEQPAAAALVIRRTVFDETGPFDERYSPAWFEDVDYCRRLHESGHAIFLVPSAKVTHRGGSSREHLTFAEFTDLWYRNLFRYAEKWFTAGQAETLRWAIVAGMLLRCAATLAGAGDAAVPRFEAVRAYAGVFMRALRRWDSASQSR
jgi:N-acetylglucosaminyl-diphospho-decaprenol L-rhamnosyltransferase